jgi:hypothetical protein
MYPEGHVRKIHRLGECNYSDIHMEVLSKPSKIFRQSRIRRVNAKLGDDITQFKHTAVEILHEIYELAFRM